MATSIYRGVRAERKKWRADIQIDGKKHFLGYFRSETEAALAFNTAIDKHNLKRKKNKI